MLKKLLLVYCQLLLVCGCSWGQPIFQKRLQVSPVASMLIRDVFEKSDSSFIVTGSAVDSLSNYGSYIAEIDTNGNILWFKQYRDFLIRAATLNTDNTLSFAGGYPSSFDTLFYLRTDFIGNTLNWFKIQFMSAGFVSKIIATSDSGNLILATNDFGSFGNEKEYGCIIKIDKTGNIKWVKHFGGGLQTFLVDAKEIAQGVYEIYGSSTSLETDTVSTSHHNVFVLRLDSAGNQTACHAIIETSNEIPWKYFIKSNGNRVFALSSGKLGGGPIITFIETDSSLNTIWSKCYFDGVTTTMDDFINIGDTMIGQSGFMFRLYDSSGNLVAAPNIHGLYGANKLNMFYKHNSFYVFGGTSNAPFSFQHGVYFKINNMLNAGCYQNNNGPNIQVLNVPVVFQDTIIHDTTVVYVVTYDSIFTGNIGLYFNTDCFGYTNIEDVVNISESLEVYPLPFASYFNIISSERINAVLLYNTLGQCVVTNYILKGNSSAQIVLQQQAPHGVFLLKVILENNKVYYKKILRM